VKKVSLRKALGSPIEWFSDESASDSRLLLTVSSPAGAKSLLLTSRGIYDVNPGQYVQAPKERVVKRVHPVIRAVKILGTTIGWVATAAVVLFTALAVTHVISPRVVLTGSMVPTINPGDLEITVSASHRTPHIGDIVVYTGRRFDGTKVADFSHRIISGDAVNGFVVKGDANPSPDTQHPTLKDIQGVVVYVIPFVGNLLNPQIFLLLLLAGFGGWLIVDSFRDPE